MKHNIIGITVACNEVGDPRFFCLTEVIERFFWKLDAAVYIFFNYNIQSQLKQQKHMLMILQYCAVEQKLVSQLSRLISKIQQFLMIW